MFRTKTGFSSDSSSSDLQEFKSDLRHMHEDLISRLYILQDQISVFTGVQVQLNLEQTKLTQVVQSMKNEMASCVHQPFPVGGRRASGLARNRRQCEDDDQAPVDLAVSQERTSCSAVQHKESVADTVGPAVRPTSAKRSNTTGSLRFEKMEEDVDVHVATERQPRSSLYFSDGTTSMRNSLMRPGAVFFQESAENRMSIFSEANRMSTLTEATNIDVSTGRSGRLDPDGTVDDDSYIATPTNWFKKNAEGVDFDSLTKAAEESAQQRGSRISKRTGFDQKTIKPSTNRRFDLQRLDVTEVIETPKCQIALHPDRPFRTSLDTIALLLLLHDAITVPFLMCWDIPEADYSWGMWVTRIFWTLDLPLSLVTGFRNKEQMLELRLIPSMCHYLKTWFFPDLFLVILDWLGFLMKDLRILRAARVRSSFRAFRLVRAFSKMPRAADIWARLVLASDKKEIHVVMSVLRVIFVILWINHLVACGWYAMGRWVVPDTGFTWIQNENEYLYRHSMFYEYWTSLHWAITQMTPGSMEVVPKCSVERLYTVITLLIGLVVGSTLIAILSSIMTQYRLQLEDKSKKFMQLQVFLSQQKIDALLSMAIKRNVTMRVAQKQRLKKKDVEYLKEIPLEMHKELCHGVYMNVIGRHKFMNAMSELDRGDAMRALCNSAFQLISVNAGEFLFEEGELGEKMLFVMEGCFQYLPGPRSAEGAFPRTTDQLYLNRGDWCSEPALWTEWEHLGSLYVSSASEVLWIRAQEMQKELAAFPHTMDVVSAYCSAFHNHLNERGVIHSDLPFRLDYADIIFSMTQRQRLSLSAPAIDRVKHQRLRGLFKRKPHEQLEKEVMAGKCLLATLDGELERTVYVVAVRLCQNGDSRCLVKLGETDPESTDFKPMCVLPGTKKMQGETLVNSLHRLLSNDLKALSSDIEMYLDSGCEQTSSIRESPTYGIRTRYIRSIVHGVLKNDANLCRMEVPAKARKAAEGARSLLDFTLSHVDYERRQKAVQAISAVSEVFFMMTPNNGAGTDSRMSYMGTYLGMDEAHSLESLAETNSMFTWLTTSQLEDLSCQAADLILRKWIAEFKDVDPASITSNAKRHMAHHPSDESVALGTVAEDSLTVADEGQRLPDEVKCSSHGTWSQSSIESSTSVTAGHQGIPHGDAASPMIVGL